MDPISDMLIRIKNAQTAGLKTVQVSYSKFKHEIIKTMEAAGLVKASERRGKKIRKFLDISLNPQGSARSIKEIKLLSHPSRRLYASNRDIKTTNRNASLLLIVSTSKGVMSGAEAAKQGLGGQLIAEIT